jgi:hypothetical protein
MSTVLSVLGTVLVGAFGIWFAWYAKKKEQEKKDDLKVTTNPPDTDALTDIDALDREQRMRNVPQDGDIPPGK